jgi:gluconolactonase
VITNPPRVWGRHAPPDIYPDPDILVIDPVFKQTLLGITAIRRVWTGIKWAEGPAWSSEGQYLVFSDVQGRHAVSLYLGGPARHAIPQAILEQ